MNTLRGKTIGFLGLGLMGRPMCRNLLRAGAELVVYNRSRSPRVEIENLGATAVNTPAEVAQQADTLILMVADTQAVTAVLEGAEGILNHAQPGTLIIDMGTTLMPATRTFADQALKNNCLYVDAPVSGGTLGAAAGDLTIMAGGTAQSYARALPILKTLGRHITHVGSVGAGQVAKAANQVIVGLNIGALAEALALARAAGVDPARVCAALEGGFADSRVLKVHGQRMINRDFTPGAKATIQRKDMAQAVELASELGLELPATRLSRELYDHLINSGGADLDHSALIKIFDTCSEKAD